MAMQRAFNKGERSGNMVGVGAGGSRFAWREAGLGATTQRVVGRQAHTPTQYKRVPLFTHIYPGGSLVWIAPSGGRDRPDADGKWTPDPFDPTAVELMASLIGRAKKPGHLYPMAMYSYPIMPPPKKVR